MKWLRKLYSELVRYFIGYKVLNDNFFTSTKKADYEKLVGRCFMPIGGGEVIKILAIPTEKEYCEFIFERYEQYLDGKWYVQDYNWLQENVYGKYGVNSKYVDSYTLNRKKYANISSQADMNICSENMYHLGKDRHIYVNIACGDTWLKYREISNDKFERIKKEAIKNDKFEIEKERN